MESKLYFALVLTVEIIVLIIRCFGAMLESLYRLVVPEEEKSVEGEIVLVSFIRFVTQTFTQVIISIGF